MHQRYITGGVDDVLAVRSADVNGANRKSIALVSDRMGSTLAAMKPDGTQETQTVYFSRNPFGGLEGASGTGGSTNTQTGFTGASTPNASGGFVYLRNRWYDPQTGRFLSQDPIGLAGGVNLYGYAGNNPVMFTDPFGLCPPELTGRPCQNILRGSPMRLRTDIPSGFGMVRGGGNRAHQGADYLASFGQNVTAADQGQVDRVENDPDGYGNFVQLSHRDAQGNVVSFTQYAHLAAPSSLQVGASVQAGQVVGNAGNSGNAVNQPTQVHFEIRTQSRPGGGLNNRIDPVRQFQQQPLNLFDVRIP